MAERRRGVDADLAAKGLIGSTRGVRKVVKARTDEGFTVAKRKMFLDGLAATCNIKKAARYAGVASTTVYRTRNRDAAFAEQWQTAMAIGYDRLEALVLEHGGAGGSIDCDPEHAGTLAEAIDGGEVGGGVGGGTGEGPFDFERALTVLRYARAARHGEPNRRSGRPPKVPTRAEVNAALMKALAAERARGGGEEQ